MPVDPNLSERVSLIESIHPSGVQLVLALSGGGSLVLGDLLSVPGGSRTLLEATVPYSTKSVDDYLGRVPDRYCCRRTARFLAMTSFHRGMRIIRSRAGANAPDDLDDFIDLIGVGCTASLATNREKKGEHRIHIATQTLRRTIVFSLVLLKGARSRREEERLVADLILNAVENARRENTPSSIASTLPSALAPTPFGDDEPALEGAPAGGENEIGDIAWNPFGFGTSEDCPLRETLPLFLKEGETIQGRQAIGSPPLVDLFFGKTWAVLWRDGKIRYFRLRNELPSPQTPIYNPQAEFMQAIFPGSFNPIHQGHLTMLDMAESRLGSRVALEISVQNVDKPSLDYIELEDRLGRIGQSRPGQAVWLTQTPFFEEKSELFRGATFVVGADTLRRFAELRFYHESTHRLHDVLRIIGFHQCRFLVFARKEESGIESLRTLNVPDMLRSLADEVPESEFTMRISSRVLRLKEN